MKIYVLTEVDLRHVGYSPNTILLFASYNEAVAEMKKMYAKAMEKFKTNEKSVENVFSEAEGYAYVGNADYRLDINECELDLRNYIHDIQEMTVVAEEQGVRSKLMEQSKSRSDVWLLIQKWTEEFHKKTKDYDWGKDRHFYDEIDTFVGEKNKMLDITYPEIKRIPETKTNLILITDKELFGNTTEHEFEITAEDGEAHGKGITLTYPKLADLTAEQIEEIEDYTGYIFKSGCITPWDVCLKYGKPQFSKLMYTSNGHDDELVRKINGKWITDKERFKPILIALYTRDIDEITDSDSFRIPKWLESKEHSIGYETRNWEEYNKRCLEDMTERWDLFADNYLQHIADDGDLETILSFLR